MNKYLITAFGMALAMPAIPALATNGYFAHGYGLKAKGMGGAATALSQDSFGGANNPASMVWAGSRMDIGLDWFRPVRSAARTGAGFSTLNGGVESDSRNFFIPGFGYNQMVSEKLSFGLLCLRQRRLEHRLPRRRFQMQRRVCEHVLRLGTIGR